MYYSLGCISNSLLAGYKQFPSVHGVHYKPFYSVHAVHYIQFPSVHAVHYKHVYTV